MAAKTAHIMLGHGSEIINEKIIIPPGCTVVVEVHSGEVNYLDGFDKIFNYNNKQIFLDPINNYKELVDNFASTKRSFAIYEEGSICPEFYYSLSSYWDSGGGLNHDEIRIQDSGVVSYPFTFIKPKYSSPRDIYKNTDTSDIFIDKYRMSILPTKEQISSAVNETRLTNLKDVMNKLHKINNLTNILNFKQSELFKILPPGVFYNFICRGTSDDIREKALTTISIGSNGNDDPYKYNHTVQRYQLKNSIRLPLKNRTRGHYFAPEISDQISEAEIHRKPYIGKMGFNNINPTKLVAEISKLKLDISRFETYIRDFQKRIDTLKDMLRKGNTSVVKLLDDYMYYVTRKLEDIEQLKEKLKFKEKQLNLSINNNPINTSINNYLWEKRNNKWKKIAVTIKNRNNKGPLPEGWRVYSTNNETWYKSPSGKLKWERPNITYKNKNNKGNLPPGWTLVSDGNVQWYMSSDKVQWERPSLTPPVVEHPVVEHPVVEHPVVEHPVVEHPVIVEPPSLNIVLDPSIKLSNSNARGPLPTGWKYYFNKGQKYYISPSGKIYDKRPVIKISKENSMGPLPSGWFYVTDGYSSWYKDSRGKTQQERPT